MPERKWKQIEKTAWRCTPWTIGLFFIDGCSLYKLTRDGESKGYAYVDELQDAMQAARDIEQGEVMNIPKEAA